MIVGFDGSRAFINKKTGTEEYSYQLLKNLLKIDQKNKYVIYIRPGTIHDTIVARNVQYRQISLGRLWTQVGLSTQTFKDKLDVLFIPAHTLPLIRKPGLKTVVTVHDLGSEYLPKTHHIKQRLYLGLMQKHQLKGTTRLIAVSKSTKEDLVKKIGISEEKISVVYEGYDQDLFKPVRNDRLRNILKHYDIEKDNYFLFVGTVQPRKNLDRLIRAFSNLCHSGAKQSEAIESKNRSYWSLRSLQDDNTKLAIVGSKGWLSDDIYTLPKKLGIQSQVKFLDYVKKEDLPALYSGAIALTFPSLFEGFGLPILEAQVCGCPVITSNISSMPEIAGKGAILVNPYSIDDIVDGMRKMEDGRWGMEIVKRGLENVKRFSWEKCAQDTLKVLQGVVDGQS